MDDQDESGLFAISVDPSDYATAAKNDISDVARDHQSEADFQAQRAAYQAKLETGQIHTTLPHVLPSPSTGHEKPVLSKPQIQTLYHAIEELYFFRHYTDAVKVIDRALETYAVKEGIAVALAKWRTRCVVKSGETK
ncbi:hypothetical protein BJ546DRAFT_635778 [Cryomyces antarcticus]